MFFLFELTVIIALCAFGCWTKRAAVIFLPTTAAALALFAIVLGNPIGLLTSAGGWIILDSMLAIAALIAHASGHYEIVAKSNS